MMLCRKHQARGRHCERSEAISDVAMDFSAYQARDCHGPSGLAMTFCKGFLQSNYLLFEQKKDFIDEDIQAGFFRAKKTK